MGCLKLSKGESSITFQCILEGHHKVHGKVYSKVFSKVTVKSAVKAKVKHESKIYLGLHQKYGTVKHPICFTI